MVHSPPPTGDSPFSPIDVVDISDDADNNLQPFFVLHKVTPKEFEKSSGPWRTRRKLEMLSSSPKSTINDNNDVIYEQLRLEAFELSWTKIDFTIKEVLKEINLNLFKEIHQWVRESFSTIGSTNPSEIRKPYPITDGATCKQIPAALVFTKNVDFVDYLLLFQDLRGYMQSNGCHAAYLSSSDFSIKHGIGSCIRSLSRQLISEASDAVGVPSIASWYCESQNYHNPIVIIIEDMEQCDGGVMADFIKMLREWAMKIPVILVMGVTTTFDAIRRLLPLSLLQNLQPCKFTPKSPRQRMDSLIEAVLVKLCSGLFISHKVAGFLRNHFLKHDGTITSFLKALKLACAKHFIKEPLSFLCPGMLHEDFEVFWSGKCGKLTEGLRSYAFDLPSCQSWKTLKGDNLVQGLCELKRLQNSWSSVVLCLFEVGKLCKMQLLDIFCEAVDPVLCNPRALGQQLLAPLTGSHRIDATPCFPNGGFISQVIQKVRELPVEPLYHLVNKWSLHLGETNEMGKEVRELQSKILLPISGGKQPDNIKRHSASSAMGKGTTSMNDEAAMLLVSMVRKFLVPIESAPFHEIVCFKDVAALKSALIGDPRRVLQDDLLKSDGYLQSSTSCGRSDSTLSSSNHDTAIMYSLAQEYGDLINIHDWYHSFKIKILNCSAKAIHKVQHSPASKKRKEVQHSPAAKKRKVTSVENEATAQARFCKAVTELQITGLVGMPSRRRPDFLQRICL